jgi:hypothetical protein
MTISMASLYRAFGQARQDLADVGLLAPGEYLDRIDCARSSWPGGFRDYLGFFDDDGVICIFFNAPAEAYRPGNTLTDIIRHEFAHAWHWLDRRFVTGPWFRDAFGGSYAIDEWEDQEDVRDPDEYVTDYAMESPKEDFAETFMTFLRNHQSLSRFRSRRGVYRKLRAVKDAVKRAADERVGHVRGPR